MKILKYLIIVLVFYSATIYSQNKDSRVWNVIKISYDTVTRLSINQVLGTAFFIADNYCLTAFHVVKDSSPMPGYQVAEFILANTNGDAIGPLTLRIGSIPHDYAICKVNTKGHEIFIWKYTDQFLDGDEVYSVGFPPSELDSLKVIHMKALGNPVEAGTINIFSTELSGKIIQEDSLDIEIQGQFYENKKVIVLDYAAIGGCSGSPLILKRTNEVVGIISFGTDPKYSISMASRMKDLIPTIEANVKPWK